ncbi:MAG TPA: helix-turn-helix transcriptional regulator [Steroidobacteraceae bacterium]|nr:helix-turn-helix transcriptional regulator [Steroidobacteraceae bacterium]
MNERNSVSQSEANGAAQARMPGASTPASVSAGRAVGELLRAWRQRRHLSQLDLACAADVSARHMSFLETGRSQPSREMLLRLAERLAIPLRERNPLLLSAGYAPMFSERPLDDPALRQARKAVDLVLAGHEPYPAIAVDRHWTLVSSNGAMRPLFSGADSGLLQPPVNVLRLGLHPRGLAPRVVNYFEWREHVLMRLQQQVDATADPVLAQLLSELRAYPAPDGCEADSEARQPHDYGGVVVPIRLRTQAGIMSFFGTTTVFGTPLDITLAELAIESFFPADAATAQLLGRCGVST